MKKIFFIVIGIIFIILGVIGLIFPIVPQIPFLVIGVGLLIMNSEKFKEKFLGSRLYNEHLKSHIEKNKLLSKIWSKLID